MTPESNTRIGIIAKWQKALANRVKNAESVLYEMLADSFGTLRTKPAYIVKVWDVFYETTYAPLFSRFASDIQQIPAINTEYFAGSVAEAKAKDIAEIVSKEIDLRLGLQANGKIIKGRYMDTLLQDQTAKRNVQQFLTRTRALKNDTVVKSQMKELVRGVKDQGGEISKFFDQNVYDTYQEADRVAQNINAEQIGLPAAIYVGGLIDGSRPFCIARNRKIFTREEIALFGTSEDTYGGYSDKSTGSFGGKPKAGYDPFTQCGGHRCRHHLSWVSKEYAVRLDKGLEITPAGLLIRKQTA